MAYADTNFRTKKELKEAVKSGKTVRVISAGGIFPPKSNGTEYLEGPHYPEPHKWYAQVTVKDGVITAVK